jgi:hypothetical protein
MMGGVLGSLGNFAAESFDGPLSEPTSKLPDFTAGRGSGLAGARAPPTTGPGFEAGRPVTFVDNFGLLTGAGGFGSPSGLVEFGDGAGSAGVGVARLGFGLVGVSELSTEAAGEFEDA